MPDPKLRLQIKFPASMETATEFARAIVEVAELDNAMIRYGQAVKGDLCNVWGFYIEGRTAEKNTIENTIGRLMTDTLKMAQFELKDGSHIMPSSQPKDVWHVSF